ncbi:c-type cytochrome [Brevirhabdus sp.]|uniref:c-type cytochrome n=1 Tax=Brevirhabdus sp. TaxID=2004514 RepID=UPI004059D50A
MFDTMTLTKIVGALCGTLLVFLLGSWFADTMYFTEAHGEEGVQGYKIEVASADAAPKEAAPQVDIATLMASADPGKGERVFSKCKACHKLEKGANGVGPYLYGVVGRPIATAEGYNYSDALSGKQGDWTPEHLSAFLTSPKSWAPGTKMGFAGLKNATDRANVIAYLQSVGG